MDYTSLSRAVSHALRHEPDAYGLTLDAEGWVSVQTLIEALAGKSQRWAALRESDLRDMIGLSAKQRHELTQGRIRALYGHSTGRRIERSTTQPPEGLYHGTSPEAASLILVEGLKPIGRQSVHMSADKDGARVAGMRKSGHPSILVVRAGDAWRAGTNFYEGNAQVWLADYVPPTFIALAP